MVLNEDDLAIEDVVNNFTFATRTISFNFMRTRPNNKGLPVTFVDVGIERQMSTHSDT